MALQDLLSRAARFAHSTATTLQPLAALLPRLVIGHAFILTGLGKWQHFERTTDFFRSLGIPAPTANAAFVASLELVGGTCLILGLGTRIFAALLSSTMVVALLTADRGSLVDALAGRGDQGLTDIASFAFLMFLAWLVTFGAGAWSVDRLLAPRVHRALGLAS